MEEENSMAEPVRNDDPLSAIRWPETPSNSSVRSEAPTPPLTPEQNAGYSVGEWPHRQMTEAAVVPVSDDSRLHDVSEAVGTALGAVVNEARELPARLQGRMGELKRRFQVISGRGTAELAERASEWSEEAESKIAGTANEARREIFRWQVRARLYARSEPFRFVAAAAIAGLSVGFLLGLWRDE
jgi:ElaB/YqjD/DUF883 family membrane-anchored ribosome-binding protein